MIGFTPESLHWLEKFMLDLEQVSIFYPTSMERSIELPADTQDTSTEALKSSDGVSNNWRSKKSLKKIRREMLLKLTQE